MKQTRALMEGAILISLFAIITLLVVYVPVIGILFWLVLPLPLILYTLRYGAKLGFWMSIVSLPVIFITSSITGVFLAIMSAFTGVALGFSLKKKDPAIAILSSSFVSVLCIMMFFVLSILFMDINIIDRALTQSQEAIDSAEYMMRNSVHSEEINKNLGIMRDQLDTAQYLFPTAIVVLGIIYAFLSYLIAKPLLRRFSPDIPNLKPFRELKFPQSVVVLYLIIVMLSFLPLEKGQMLYSIALNGEFILGFLIFIQGLSFIFFYCHKKQYPKAAAVIAVILGFVHPVFMAAIRILGVLDMGFHIRNKVK
ncbi:YybS family protein [Bacillus subtilis]|uniref:YybS family protein n=1 Tax=Bacillus subtilis TaxID=1423 RepID=UPI000C769410|nr:YybS family protein [Bacillus subtilis]MCO8148705.1 YybS family protein [Bacillus subtilis]MDQ4710964.1 YybS family protein [Bacillus subtilis]MEC1422881.1 YybS family protein [Bacillus subtilis]MEC2177139.1 YybS family protein [Bacillus subtilis]PLV31846.1 hypothetical protein BSP4_43890 [Bacillus subtilis subsp. subtilis]